MVYNLNMTTNKEILQINIGDKINMNLTVEIEQNGEYFKATCTETNATAYATSYDEAKTMIAETIVEVIKRAIPENKFYEIAGV